MLILNNKKQKCLARTLRLVYRFAVRAEQGFRPQEAIAAQAAIETFMEQELGIIATIKVEKGEENEPESIQ